MSFVKKFYRGVSVTGLRISNDNHSIERLLNICLAKGICVWGEKRSGTCHEFRIYTDCENEFLKMAKKCGVTCSVKKQYGLIKILKDAKRNMTLCAGVIAALVTVYLCSEHVWKVTFFENYKYSSNELLSIIENENVYAGVAKKDFDCESLEKYIRSSHPDISFVSAYVDGCVLKVTIKEGIKYESETQKDDLCSIIADTDGAIVNIITRQGTAVVKAGSKVKKNDVLIAGEYDVTDDGGNVVKREKVSASADVLIRKKYTKKLSFPLQYVQREYNGKEKRSFYIEIGDNKKILYRPFKLGEHCDIMSCKTSFFRDYISLGITHYYEYEPCEKTYDKNDAKEKVNAVVSEYLSELAQNNIKVNNYDYTFSFDDVNVNVTINLDVTGAFTKRKKIREEYFGN